MSKKSTNLVIVALILSAVVLIVGYGYTQNPEYIAKQNMSKAETAITRRPDPLCHSLHERPGDQLGRGNPHVHG